MSSGVTVVSVKYHQIRLQTLQAKVFIYRPINCSLDLPRAAFKRFINQNETKTEYKFNRHKLQSFEAVEKY